MQRYILWKYLPNFGLNIENMAKYLAITEYHSDFMVYKASKQKNNLKLQIFGEHEAVFDGAHADDLLYATLEGAQTIEACLSGYGGDRIVGLVA